MRIGMVETVETVAVVVGTVVGVVGTVLVPDPDLLPDRT